LEAGVGGEKGEIGETTAIAQQIRCEPGRGQVGMVARSAIAKRGEAKGEKGEENEEDGGENGKPARGAGLYSGSGGEAAPCPTRAR
jgi:hypothetical protein